MVNLDGTKAVSKAAKGTHDRLKALEVAIYNLRSSENDKNWQNVEKCLQVRSFLKKLPFSIDKMNWKENFYFRDFVHIMKKLSITYDPSMSVLKEAPRKYF